MKFYMVMIIMIHGHEVGLMMMNYMWLTYILINDFIQISNCSMLNLNKVI